MATSVTFLNHEPLSLSFQHFSPVFFGFLVLCGGAWWWPGGVNYPAPCNYQQSPPQWVMSAFCKAPKPLPKTTLLDLLDTPSASQETVWSHYLGSRNTPRDFCPLSLVSLFSALYFFPGSSCVLALPSCILGPSFLPPPSALALFQL